MQKHDIPRATAKRLPLYYRYLKFMQDSGKKKVSSTELSEAVQVDSATIRRDFSYFGELGKRGYGYDVTSLLEFFTHILNEDQVTKVAVVGVGNLGTALLKYRFHQSNSIQIIAAFDIKEELAHQYVGGVEIFPLDELEKHIVEKGIDVAILTVPTEEAQVTVNRLIQTGIKGIMNFTPIRLTRPKNVLIQNVDLTTELQTLIYFLHHYK